MAAKMSVFICFNGVRKETPFDCTFLTIRGFAVGNFNADAANGSGGGGGTGGGGAEASCIAVFHNSH